MIGTGVLEQRRHAASALAVGGLAASAWLALWAWESSPYGRYLHHDTVASSGFGPVGFLTVFLGGWLLMIVAMMLPSTLSLVTLFSQVVAGRPDRRTLLAWLIGGYLIVWLWAGTMALAGDVALHGVVQRVGWVERHPWVVAAAVVTFAGLYQLTPIKERCLHKCRSPRLLIFSAWRGSRPAVEAFTLGVRHGRFCLGCCWALMLLMFALGLGSLGWMLALGTAMAIEKNAVWGTRLTTPLGGVLLLAAFALVGGGLF